MKAKEIQDLINFISKSGLEEVNIETEEFKIKVKKSSEVKSQIVQAAPAAAPVQAVATASTEPTKESKEAAAQSTSSDDKYVEVKSPMIGTFYRTPNPDSPAFVNVGDTIKKGDTVCIVEAMKLFNEIESEVSGKIVKVLVENATPVEYDQPLFLVDPS